MFYFCFQSKIGFQISVEIERNCKCTFLAMLSLSHSWGTLGSGPRYQILSHVFARCASQKTYCHARFACYSRMVVGFLTCSMCEKCDISYTSGHCLRYIIFIGELAIMFSNTKSVVTQHCSLSLFSTVAIQWMNVAIYKPFIVVTGTGHHNLGDSSYGCVCQ